VNLDMVGRIRTTPAATSFGSEKPTTASMAPATTRAAHGEIAMTTPATTQSSGEGILYVGGTGTAQEFDHILDAADRRSPLVLKNIGKGGLGPSDHMSFALKKIPVLFFFSGLHPDYHRPTDDADKINYAGLELVVDLVHDVVAQIAAEPKPAYVSAFDSQSMRIGSPRGTRVTLGVVPDYSGYDEGGGVKISGTTPGSPAANAGLKAGDVIVKWDEKKLDTLSDLSDMLANGKPGQKVKLTLMRDGKPVEVEATLAERKG
jgi:aminopeptidase YwaD